MQRAADSSMFDDIEESALCLFLKFTGGSPVVLLKELTVLCRKFAQTAQATADKAQTPHPPLKGFPNKGEGIIMRRKKYRRRKSSYVDQQSINYGSYHGLSGGSGQSNSPYSVKEKRKIVTGKNTLYFGLALVVLIGLLQVGVILADRFFGEGDIKVEEAGDTSPVQAAPGTVPGDANAGTETGSPGDNPSYLGDPTSGYGQLVNRSYPIPDAQSYHPSDLENVAGSYQQMRAEAAQAMNKMIEDFKTENPSLPIYAQSGYRTYDRQVQLYNNQIKRRGEALGTVYSAIPGTSEHELGLALDLSVDGSTLNWEFADSVQGKWFAEHCYEYGFILRFPKDKQAITGIIYEPWHFRYVGVDIAKDIANKGITTLEEYYGMYLKAEDLDPYLEHLQ